MAKCHACGEEREDTVLSTQRHECQYPVHRFFVREGYEYKYEDGVLMRRWVKYIEYSEHETTNPKDVLDSTEWAGATKGINVKNIKA